MLAVDVVILVAGHVDDLAVVGGGSALRGVG